MMNIKIFGINQQIFRLSLSVLSTSYTIMYYIICNVIRNSFAIIRNMQVRFVVFVKRTSYLAVMNPLKLYIFKLSLKL